MNEHGDQLRTAFETHEHLAPDAAAVYSRVQELSRSYQRRRRGVQAAGGAVLGVSLIAGAVSLPGLLPGQRSETVNTGPATMPNMTPAPLPSAFPSPSSKIELEQWYIIYAKMGYGYDEAVKLAQLWRSKDIGAVKAEAGRRLMAGETLPIPPSPDQNEPAPENTLSDRDQYRAMAFAASGYTYDDAIELAGLWKIADPSAAKVAAGKRLLAHKKLPIKPSKEANPEALRVSAFFATGYDYDDAVRLARLWKKTDPYQAKIEAGKRILAGDTLPIKP